MKGLVLTLALAFGATGCFTTWAGLRLSGLPGAPDENARTEKVPQPGIREYLSVALVNGQLSCRASQSATDIEYKASYRYGKGWKTATGVMFAAEALVATALYFAKPDDPAHILGAGFFAVDAVGTGALFFVPRKEIYSTKNIPMTTTIRSTCPDGLVLEIAGDTYPVAATGSIGELGQLALDDWMRAPTGSLLVSYSGRTASIQTNLPSAVFEVPVGTLSQVALP